MSVVPGPAVTVQKKLESAFFVAEKFSSVAHGYGPGYSDRVKEATERLRQCLAEWDELAKPVEVGAA